MLNTVVGILEAMGIMVGSPVFSWGFRKGMEMGGGWVGLPFAAGTVITAGAAVVVWGYRIPGQVEREIVEDDRLESPVSPTMRRDFGLGG